jgi:hypothetical protein
MNDARYQYTAAQLRLQFDAQRWRMALEQIAAMDPENVRADDLGRAARIARTALETRS